MPAKLVAIGDSLTQGFQHGAIRRTEHSYPAMVSAALGGTPFRQAAFDGCALGGPLLDLELLGKNLSDAFGSRLDWWELPEAFLKVRSSMDVVEDYWERGAGAEATDTGPLHHNLAVWGFEVLDSMTLSDGVCQRSMTPARDNFVAQLTEFGMYRTARRVLNPRRAPGLEELSQLDAAAQIAREEGGIENLLVVLGANNALKTCLVLDLQWSQPDDLQKLAHERTCTIWRPEHFRTLDDRLAERIKAIGAERVFVGTIPHITIAPVTRGVTPDAKKRGVPERVDGYYEYYTHFWIWDENFRAARHPRITREHARNIDATIDAYNAHIQQTAVENGWHVVDFCKMLDKLAWRRNDGKPCYEFPANLASALKRNPKTAFRARQDGTIDLDTRYIRLPEKGTSKPHRGGLFGLDGVHPTTIGYGLMADLVLQTMGDKVPGASREALDWDAIVAADTLVTDTPAILSSLEHTLGFLDRAEVEAVIKRLSGFVALP